MPDTTCNKHIIVMILNIILLNAVLQAVADQPPSIPDNENEYSIQRFLKERLLWLRSRYNISRLASPESEIGKFALPEADSTVRYAEFLYVAIFFPTLRHGMILANNVVQANSNSHLQGRGIFSFFSFKGYWNVKGCWNVIPPIQVVLAHMRGVAKEMPTTFTSFCPVLCSLLQETFLVVDRDMTRSRLQT